MSHHFSSSFGQGQFSNAAAAKSRRALASSDEEVDELIFEESHRVGWPLLQPLPSAATLCDGQECDEYVTDWQEASSIIHDILVTQAVGVFRFDLFRQRTAGTSSTPVPMLRIVANNRESGSWHNAVLRIVRSLQSFVVDNTQIYVEMVERGYPRVLPAETEDAAVDSWEDTLGPRIVGILMRQPSLWWQSLSLVRLSSARSPDPFLTVLVEAANVRDSGWGNTRAEILSALNGTGCKLEIWQMRPVAGLGGEDLFSANLDHTRFGEVMSIGDGIAPAEEENSTGTLGGFVRLKSKEGETDHMLTNFHVIKTPRLQQKLEPSPLQSICLPRGSTTYPAKVPSNFDAKLMLQRLDDEIEDYRKRIHDSLGGGPSYIDRAEMGHAASKRHVESTKKEIARCEEQRSEIVENSKRPAGAVRATSGYQHLAWGNKKLALDWALVEIDSSRLFDQLPQTSRTRTWVQREFEIPAWASNPNHRWSRSPPISQKVVKFGRMTGWTCGRLGKAKCFWRSLAKDDYEVGDWHDRYGTVVECLQVFDRYEEDTPEETPEDARRAPLGFAAGGDSGSVVRDLDTGVWLGLLFGAHRGGWALMTPIAAVMHSIESVTGGKVVDPLPID